MHRTTTPAPPGGGIAVPIAVRAALGFACLLALPGAREAHGTTFHVAVEADSIDALPGDGICADAGGACSLRAAVQESNASQGSDRIDLPAGRYRLTLAGTREDAAASGDLDIHDALAIVGEGALESVIDGNAGDTVLELHSDASQVRLEGVMITNGFFEASCAAWSCAGAGGAIVRAGVGLTVRHVDFRANRAERFNTMSALLNLGCVDGDHVRVIGNGPVEGSINPPTAAFGGAFEPVEPPPCITLDHSEFAGNEGAHAGVMELRFTRMTLRRSLVHDNEGGAGAFLFNIANEVLLENVTITRNRGRSYGAFLSDGNSFVHVRHATITDNEGSLTGGIADANSQPFENTSLANTLLTGNRSSAVPSGEAGDCAGDFRSEGGLLVGNAVSTDGTPAPCQIRPGAGDQYPVPLAPGALADHGGATWTILPPGVAIDAAVAVECTPTDQRDRSRPAGEGCDIGAVERDATETIFTDGFESAAFGAARTHAARRAFDDGRSARRRSASRHVRSATARAL